MDKMKFLLIFIVFISLPFSLMSHGVDLLVVSGGVGVEALYDSGEPISDADVEIYSPGDSENIFQAGSTDRNGRFLFFPDSDGEWKIIVNDGMGHGGSQTLVVKDSGKSLKKNGDPPGRIIKLLSGLSVIFGITGILFFIFARKEMNRRRNAHS